MSTNTLSRPHYRFHVSWRASDREVICTLTVRIIDLPVAERTDLDVSLPRKNDEDCMIEVIEVENCSWQFNGEHGNSRRLEQLPSKIAAEVQVLISKPFRTYLSYVKKQFHMYVGPPGWVYKKGLGPPPPL